jgi:hypothetical protein
MFVYEGRTSSILSANSSANTFATFNPLANRNFDGRFGGMMTMEEWGCLVGVTRSVEEVAGNVLNANQMTQEERHYLQLLAVSQLGGVITAGKFTPTESPAVLVNQAGSSEISGNNWLLPVSCPSSYGHYFDVRMNDQSFRTSSAPNLVRVRLY